MTNYYDKALEAKLKTKFSEILNDFKKDPNFFNSKDFHSLKFICENSYISVPTTSGHNSTVNEFLSKIQYSYGSTEFYERIFDTILAGNEITKRFFGEVLIPMVLFYDICESHFSNSFFKTIVNSNLAIYTKFNKILNEANIESEYKNEFLQLKQKYDLVSKESFITKKHLDDVIYTEEFKKFIRDKKLIPDLFEKLSKISYSFDFKDLIKIIEFLGIEYKEVFERLSTEEKHFIAAIIQNADKEDLKFFFKVEQEELGNYKTFQNFIFYSLFERIFLKNEPIEDFIKCFEIPTLAEHYLFFLLQQHPTETQKINDVANKYKEIINIYNPIRTKARLYNRGEKYLPTSNKIVLKGLLIDTDSPSHYYRDFSNSIALSILTNNLFTEQEKNDILKLYKDKIETNSALQQIITYIVSHNIKLDEELLLGLLKNNLFNNSRLENSYISLGKLPLGWCYYNYNFICTYKYLPMKYIKSNLSKLNVFLLFSFLEESKLPELESLRNFEKNKKSRYFSSLKTNKVEIRVEGKFKCAFANKSDTESYLCRTCVNQFGKNLDEKFCLEKKYEWYKDIDEES